MFLSQEGGAEAGRRSGRDELKVSDMASALEMAAFRHTCLPLPSGLLLLSMLSSGVVRTGAVAVMVLVLVMGREKGRSRARRVGRGIATVFHCSPAGLHLCRLCTGATVLTDPLQAQTKALEAEKNRRQEAERMKKEEAIKRQQAEADKQRRKQEEEDERQRRALERQLLERQEREQARLDKEARERAQQEQEAEAKRQKEEAEAEERMQREEEERRAQVCRVFACLS